MSFSGLTTPDDCLPTAQRSLELMHRLYPLCRSLTGSGVRQTLEILADHIPLQVRKVPTGTEVFDWTVPLEWNIREAWIRGPDGRIVADFNAHNLHVVSYSAPIRARLSLEELKAHLHSLPDHPDWIPYRTAYYTRDWGFCLRHRDRVELSDGEYEVCIDSDLREGELTYAECVIPGETEQEFLVFTHICHPSLCNDNLTGIAVAAHLARWLGEQSQRRLTYRIVFAPGTIGSIAWLAQNERKVDSIRHGLVIGLLGDDGPLTYKRSRRRDSETDQIAMYVLSRLADRGRVMEFTPYGYDERQFCSPGFNLPVGRMTRSSNGEYPEYHSSGDDFSIISQTSLAESIWACAEVLRIADCNVTYVSTSQECEPQLGKRGLYRAVGGTDPGEMQHAILWVLNQSDGSKSLLDIASRSGLAFETILDAAKQLKGVGLLRRTD